MVLVMYNWYIKNLILFIWLLEYCLILKSYNCAKLFNIQSKTKKAISIVNNKDETTNNLKLKCIYLFYYTLFLSKDSNT